MKIGQHQMCQQEWKWVRGVYLEQEGDGHLDSKQGHAVSILGPAGRPRWPRAGPQARLFFIRCTWRNSKPRSMTGGAAGMAI